MLFADEKIINSCPNIADLSSGVFKSVFYWYVFCLQREEKDIRLTDDSFENKNGSKRLKFPHHHLFFLVLDHLGGKKACCDACGTDVQADLISGVSAFLFHPLESGLVSGARF